MVDPKIQTAPSQCEVNTNEQKMMLDLPKLTRIHSYGGSFTNYKIVILESIQYSNHSIA